MGLKVSPWRTPASEHIFQNDIKKGPLLQYSGISQKSEKKCKMLF